MTREIKRWALITGASSGLGVELAKVLAGRGIDMVLVARRGAPMHELADKLKRQHGVDCVVEVIDLSAPGNIAKLQKQLSARGIVPSILINNAGFGVSGAFVMQEPQALSSMIQVNISALMELTWTFGRHMALDGRGHIMLVGSMAAYQPTPLLAAYGASKAFVLSFGEALHAELAPHVGVTVLSPGLMDTGFAGVAGYTPPASARATVLEPAAVARIGIDAMFAGKSSVVAGRLNKLMAFMTRFMSRDLQAQMILKMAVS
jgi:uncharacterized protein